MFYIFNPLAMYKKLPDFLCITKGEELSCLEMPGWLEVPLFASLASLACCHVNVTAGSSVLAGGRNAGLNVLFSRRSLLLINSPLESRRKYYR